VSKPEHPTVFVCYGFCEGPQIGRSFTEALSSAGFRIAHNPRQADIFVGHSGGCFLVPTSGTTHLSVLIGVSYRPGTSIITTLYQKNTREYTSSRHQGTTASWWRKFRWNSVYFWNLRRNIAMQLALTRGLTMPPSQTLCIRNRDDDCCTPDLWQLPALSDASFVSVPGQHDDLWMHPEGYAAIIKAYYGASILASTKSK
jgi:hypothetical protein